MPTSHISSQCANTNYGNYDLYVSTQHSLQLHADSALQTQMSCQTFEEPVHNVLDLLQRALSTSSVWGVEEPVNADSTLSLRGSRLHRTHSFTSKYICKDYMYSIEHIIQAKSKTLLLSTTSATMHPVSQATHNYWLYVTSSPPSFHAVSVAMALEMTRMSWMLLSQLLSNPQQ
ncbi:hypothetical protein OG21DRAFT_1484964 [Imleria badia]|nr:hypothetical protein OG21DRAFT_1484964 [Imleria badia]